MAANRTSQSLDTDLAALIRNPTSATHDAVGDVAVGAPAAAQADSVATTVVQLVADHNALLAKLRTAGILAS